MMNHYSHCPSLSSASLYPVIRQNLRDIQMDYCLISPSAWNLLDESDVLPVFILQYLCFSSQSSSFLKEYLLSFIYFSWLYLLILASTRLSHLQSCWSTLVVECPSGHLCSLIVALILSSLDLQSMNLLRSITWIGRYHFQGIIYVTIIWVS